VRSGFRFTIALTLAVALGGWLLWTSFGGAVQSYAGPEELTAGSTYRLNGLVAEGSPRDAAALAQTEGGLRFWLVDKQNPKARVRVVYRGSVPDTFKDKRELVLTGRLQNGVFRAERNSMIALCPSKFTDRPEDTQAST
jgi:cytochrome c-type biogenesis protein CcmE